MRKLMLFSIVFAVFTLLTSQNAYAQTSESSSTSAKIKYDLAYPGILPDHPLYKVKLVRDRIRAFLINDPRKKAELYLLQTDKEILATAMLVDKGKIELAQATAFKAEHNYTLLTYELKKIKIRDAESSFLKKLKTAALKHQEVLTSLVKRVPKEKQKSFEQVLNFSKTNLQTINKYEMRKPLLDAQ